MAAKAKLARDMNLLKFHFEKLLADIKTGEELVQADQESNDLFRDTMDQIEDRWIQYQDRARTGLPDIGEQSMAVRSFGAVSPLTRTLKLTSPEFRGTAPNAETITISGIVTESIRVAQPYLHTEYADLLRRSRKWLADDRAYRRLKGT